MAWHAMRKINVVTTQHDTKPKSQLVSHDMTRFFHSSLNHFTYDRHAKYEIYNFCNLFSLKSNGQKNDVN